MSSPAPFRFSRSRGAVARVPGWLRALALLVALLAAGGPQRGLPLSAAHASPLRAVAPLARVAVAPAQHVQSDALRAEPVLRVAAAPSFLPQPPPLPVSVWSLGRGPVRFVHWAVATPPPVHRALGHFHGQRRIPRMNSEEPPRA